MKNTDYQRTVGKLSYGLIYIIGNLGREERKNEKKNICRGNSWEFSENNKRPLPDSRTSRVPKQDLKTNKQKLDLLLPNSWKWTRQRKYWQQRKRTHYIQGTEMSKKADFLSKTIQARSQRSDIFNILKQNTVNQKFLAQWKCFSKKMQNKDFQINKS